MYDAELWRRAACPTDDKKEIIPVIELLVGMTGKAVREGLLSLDDDLPEIESPFIRKGLGLVVDGTDPELVRDILVTWIRSGGFSGSALLMRMMAADGILCIQRGVLPHVVKIILYAYLGEASGPEGGGWAETAPAGPGETETAHEEPVNPLRLDETSPVEFADTAEDAQCRRELTDILSMNGRILSEAPVSEDEILALASAVRFPANGIRILTGILESMPSSLQYRILAGFEAHDAELYTEIMNNRIVFEDLTGCSDRDIQKILREVDTADLTKALKGASPQLCEKIYRNMSNRAAYLLREDMEYIGPVRIEDLEDSQNRIVRIARLLREAGEIIIARPGDRFV